MHQPDIAGPVSLTTAVSFAALPWVSNFELGLRILALSLSVAASWYAIQHYRKP